MPPASDVTKLVEIRICRKFVECRRILSKFVECRQIFDEFVKIRRMRMRIEAFI